MKMNTANKFDPPAAGVSIPVFRYTTGALPGAGIWPRASMPWPA